MQKITLARSKVFFQYHFKFSVYEVALSGLLVALWVVSALPVFNFNLGFMHIGVTYVWPILLGLTTKPLLAIVSSIIGDNLALLSAGTGFGQWMPEYAVIPIMIVVISLLFRKLITGEKQWVWWMMVIFANLAVSVGTLVTMIVKSNVQYASRNVDSAIDFSSDVAKIVIWTMYGVVLLSNIILIGLYLWAKKHKEHIVLNLKKFISFYSLSMVIIVVTIWIWGPFAQIRYLQLYLGYPSSTFRDRYDLFLIPRILKTPISLVLYTAFILPIYKTHEISYKRINIANKW